MKSGQVVRILATDPGSVRDFEAFSRQTGNALLAARRGRRRVLVPDAASLTRAPARSRARRPAVAERCAPPPSRFPADRAGRGAARARAASARRSGAASSGSSTTCCSRRCCSARSRPRRCRSATRGTLVGVGVAFTRSRRGCSRWPRVRCSACRSRCSRRASSARSASTPTWRSRRRAASRARTGVALDQPADRRARAAGEHRGGGDARARRRHALPAARSCAIRWCIACVAGIAWHAAGWPVPALLGARAGAARAPRRCRSGSSRSARALRVDARHAAAARRVAWFHAVKLGAVPAVAWRSRTRSGSSPRRAAGAR